jgi:Ca-activated chloride channel family protein
MGIPHAGAVQPKGKTWQRRGSSIWIALAAGFAVSVGITAAYAQQDDARVVVPAGVARHSDQLRNRSLALRVNVNLVLIPVTVTDAYQRPVAELQKSNFRVLEDGVEQEVTRFSSEDSPISVGIVFDASASMLRKMEESRKAVTEFLKMSLPGDEFFLLKFSDRPEIVNSFTTKTEQIEEGLETIRPSGWTSLFDAIYLSIHNIKHARHDRRVLLVLSDGGDNDSRYTEREIKDLVKESDVRIFSISILDRSPSLEAIAEESGGRAYRVRKLEELPDLAANISAQLHSQYVLGYSQPNRTQDGKYHRVKVDLIPSAATTGLRASWKHGYYALPE